MPFRVISRLLSSDKISVYYCLSTLQGWFFCMEKTKKTYILFYSIYLQHIQQCTRGENETVNLKYTRDLLSVSSSQQRASPKRRPESRGIKSVTSTSGDQRGHSQKRKPQTQSPEPRASQTRASPEVHAREANHERGRRGIERRWVLKTKRRGGNAKDEPVVA